MLGDSVDLSSSPLLSLVNGQQQDQISVHDRALQYGDGLFETIAVKNGQLLAWERHLARLQSGCERLGISCPDAGVLLSEAKLISKDHARGVVKLIISRGEGGRGYTPPEISRVTRVLGYYEWPDYPPEFSRVGIKTTVCAGRLGSNPALAGIKHLNRLEQVLLRRELLNTDFAEAIVMDTADRVVEGTMSNIFLLRDGKLTTPDLNNAGVAGVIRAAILELAGELGLNCDICSFTFDDLLHGDELFFCNSIAGIWPVTEIASSSYERGPFTRELQELLVDKNLIVM